MTIRKITDAEGVFKMLPDEELVEITESWYWHFYNCLPPIGFDPCFLVGEPECHDDEGYPCYTLVFRSGDRFFAGKPMRRDADRFAKKSELMDKYRYYQHSNRFGEKCCLTCAHCKGKQGADKGYCAYWGHDVTNLNDQTCMTWER